MVDFRERLHLSGGERRRRDVERHRHDVDAGRYRRFVVKVLARLVGRSRASGVKSSATVFSASVVATRGRRRRDRCERRGGGTRGDAGGRQLRRPASELHSKLGSDRDRVNVVQ